MSKFQRIQVAMTTSLLLATSSLSAQAESTNRVLLDLGLTLSRFEQQVKQEVGGARGERLVEDSLYGLSGFATYKIWGPIEAGLFTQFDVGSRSAGNFTMFDAQSKAQITDATGGDFNEFWAGPLLRTRWRFLFLELGYGLIGLRNDDARQDLKNSQGATTGALTTSPTIAWMLNLGGSTSIADKLDLVFRLEYRVRYYVKRDGEAFENNLVHGTQNFTPFVGVSWAAW